MKVIWDSKRNWTIIVLLMVIGLMIYAQKTTSDSAGTDLPKKIVNVDLEEIKARGVLRAITGNNSLSYFVYRGRTMGYDYELLQKFADHLEVELEIIVAKNNNEFKLLNEGKGDIIANNLIITKDRLQTVQFTEHYTQVQQVLVQQKPENWWRYTKDQYDSKLIRNPLDLIGKEVYVRKNSTSAMRLENLSNEIGGEIIIKQLGEVSTDELIQRVSKGEIEYTIAENDMALMNATYLKNIDIETPISFPQRVAWAVRKNSPDLLEAANEWILQIKKNGQHLNIYNKYFKNSRAFTIRQSSDYFSVTGGQISVYDDLLKKHAKELNWDWRLLAAQVFKESKFKHDATSWAGASGLMQLMPETAERFGDSTLINDPIANLEMGTKYLKSLIKFWEAIPDSSQRIRFILASYNVGEGHLLDAQRLAKKHGKDRSVWDNNVDSFLVLKAYPQYYRDEVVKNGYCRGSEPYMYVKDVLDIYQHYVEHFPSENDEPL